MTEGARRSGATARRRRLLAILVLAGIGLTVRASCPSARVRAQAPAQDLAAPAAPAPETETPLAPAAAWTELPVRIDGETRQPLYGAIDPVMEKRLRDALGRRPQMARLLRNRKLAVGVVDLSHPERPRYGRLNGQVMMYAASLPKIAILLAAYEAFEDGSLEESPEVHADLTDMIRTSSNSAATRMIDRLSFEKIAEVLVDPRYSLYDRQRGGGLWVGKRYAKEGRRYPDPLKGISHAATVTQVCRFYYLLAIGQIISPERSRQMLEHLSDPGLHHKFVAVVEQRAPRARLFRKSGTWKIWHSDSILVWGPDWRRYILVAMVESPEGDRLLRELVPLVEEVLQRSRAIPPAPVGAAAPPAEPADGR